MHWSRSGISSRRLYCYDIRHAPKDLGWFGLGKPGKIPTAPSLEETLNLPVQDTLAFWTEKRMSELKNHRKVRPIYGFMRETLPQLFTLHVPPGLGIGHEIYALGEKN